MAAKGKKQITVSKARKKSRIKVGKLNKETVRDLKGKEARRIKGGVFGFDPQPIIAAGEKSK